MRRLLFILAVLFPAFAWANPAPVFYVCAHPDDCFLFMNPNLYDDMVNDAQKVVVIYLTSGDAGQAFSKTNSSFPYARERASLESMEWMADVDKEEVTARENNEVVNIRNHAIERISYANKTAYFLRLPDGDMEGNGFERYGHQSLRKLKSGESHDVAPIDGESSYADWQDLVGVLSDILTRETEGTHNVTLHLSEPDTTNNYNDHSDHTTGASGLMEALAKNIETHGVEQCYLLYKHIDYSIVDRPPNLDLISLQNKSGSFAVLTETQRQFLHYHNWDKAHLAYSTRNYYTTTTLPEGCDKQP